MINNKYCTLIPMLIDATKENRINWQNTGRQNEYSTDVASFMVSVTMVSSGTVFRKESNEPFVITLVNEEGDNIDFQEIESNDSNYSLVTTLFLEARRSFYKVGDVLDALIQELR